jgi:colanic acid/amylovoran biosynthesis glycosyltransferase
MRNVAVFRHQLFKVSEPFITQQAEALQHYRPLYLGRDRFGEGPDGAESLALMDLPRQRSFMRRMWQVMTRATKGYRELLGQQRPALIHAHFGVEGVYALPLARRLGVPLITTFHGFDATLSTKSLLASRKPSWVNYALRREQLAKQGDLFLCVSEYIRQRVIELGFPEERTHVHYIGIDTQAIQPRDSGKEKPIILHVARLVEKKGTEYLIRAFAQMADEVPNMQLVIIGDGPLKGELESLGKTLGIDGRIEFMGARPHGEVMAAMHEAAVLVLPSVTAGSGDAEGLGMVLLEAAASGVPVIGTMHGGIPEAIVDAQSGFLVPERDVGALAKRLSEMLQDGSMRRDMGRDARHLCEAKFDIGRQAERLESLYGLLV